MARVSVGDGGRDGGRDGRVPAARLLCLDARRPMRYTFPTASMLSACGRA